jgi:L-fuculose-phosphate aldolase
MGQFSRGLVKNRPNRHVPLKSLKKKHLREAQQELIETGKYLAGCGYHAGLAGNLSVRLDDDVLLCTRSGAMKGALDIKDLVLCDLSGEVIEGNGYPTSELRMHAMAYKVRRDVGAVIHAHPPTATAFAAASQPLDCISLPELVVLLGPIALVPYAPPGTDELAQELGKYLPTHHGFLLENHGALSVGKDLRQACQRMDLIEQNARVTLAVRQIGKPFQLAREQMEGLMELRTRLESKLR